MTASLTDLPSPAPCRGVLLPQLRRAEPGGDRPAPGAVASVALSRRHDAILVIDGVAQTPADLGRAGLSIRTAWDLSAANLLGLARDDGGMRFWLRPLGDVPGAPWFELAVDGAPATSWLAHPRTFTVLNDYLAARFASTPTYAFDEDTSWTLRVRGEDPSQGLPPHPGQTVVYRSGFPVPVQELRHDNHPPGSAPLLLAV